MQNQAKQGNSIILSGLLALFLVTYALGVVSFLLTLLGQPVFPIETSIGSSLWFGLVFVLGAASTGAIFLRRRWGVYGLILTWALTALLNLAFPSPVAWVTRVAGFVLVGLFFFLIRPVWKRLV
jgi:hypothetical protein